MIPSINRFIGALQGISVNGAAGRGGDVLDIAETILASSGFVTSDMEAFVTAPDGEEAGAIPIWRAIPFALLYFRDLDKLQLETEKACRLTHTDPADVAASVAMAFSVARLLCMEDDLSPLPFVREIARFVRPVNHNAYTRILGLIYPLRHELPFLCTNFSQPLELFRAALFLFLTCQACDLEAEAKRHGLSETPVLPLAYALAGSFGRFCLLTKPSLRVVMIAESFHQAAEQTSIGTEGEKEN